MLGLVWCPLFNFGEYCNTCIKCHKTFKNLPFLMNMSICFIELFLQWLLHLIIAKLNHNCTIVQITIKQFFHLQLYKNQIDWRKSHFHDCRPLRMNSWKKRKSGKLIFQLHLTIFYCSFNFCLVLFL